MPVGIRYSHLENHNTCIISLLCTIGEYIQMGSVYLKHAYMFQETPERDTSRFQVLWNSFVFRIPLVVLNGPVMGSCNQAANMFQTILHTYDYQYAWRTVGYIPKFSSDAWWAGEKRIDKWQYQENCRSLSKIFSLLRSQDKLDIWTE